jgi:hypothetical protein
MIPKRGRKRMAMIPLAQIREAVAIYEGRQRATARERATRPAVVRLRRAYQGIFRKQGELFLKSFRRLRPLFPLTEASPTAVTDTMPLLDIALEATAEEAQAAIRAGIAQGIEIGAKSLIRMVGGAGISFNLSFPEAEEYIKRVGAARVSDIDDTTRKVIREIVTKAVQNGTAWNKVAEEITDQFSHFALRPNYVVSWLNNRAELVAVTEVGNAYEEGSRVMANRLNLAGLQMEKRWAGPNDDRTSKNCQDNLAAGWIPLADDFPSGAQQPLDHPGCRHTALYRRIRRT